MNVKKIIEQIPALWYTITEVMNIAEDIMRKRLKKAICAVLTFTVISSTLIINASAYNVGDKIDKVLSTDIVTYIEGVRVPSYNIKGRTAVVVQDLNKIGGKLNFGVSFDEESRTLTVTNRDVYGYGSTEPSVYIAPAGNKPVGTPVDDVLFTDITTNFEGVLIESFNISGYTCVYADDLGKLCGTYIWDENARTVNVYRTGSYIPYIGKADTIHNLRADNSVITREDTTARWGTPSKSHIVENGDGTITVVEVGQHINLEYYDKDFNYISSFAIAKELPLFGGLYCGKDFNYIAFGQENLMEDNAREVIKIVIYDKSFVKVSEVSVSNCKTAIPFDASNADMDEDERYLVLHTSRSQYLDENGTRPQTQLTVIIDKATWQVANILGKFQYNHTSHALKEYVRIDNDRIITANYSDAAPLRGAFLQELDGVGKVLYTRSIFGVGGPGGANCTGAMIGGLEVSDSGYLVPISSIDHTLPTYYDSVTVGGIDRENRDVFILWVDKNNWEIKKTCLTNNSAAGVTGSVPYIVKLQDGNFMVLWQQFHDETESNTMCYSFVDGAGNQIGSTYTVSGKLSDTCHPIEKDGRVVWYVNSDSGRSFYYLSSAVPEVAPADDPEDIKPAETLPADGTQEDNSEDTKKDEITEVDGI